MPAVHRNFVENTHEYGKKVRPFWAPSWKALRDFSLVRCDYDFIYIDGSHIACDVLEDAVLSFRLLKPDGIMVFDDYSWEFFDNPLRHPKIAIDAFLEIYANQIEVISVDRQAIIRKREVNET
jgi:hypothetical protein